MNRNKILKIALLTIVSCVWSNIVFSAPSADKLGSSDAGVQMNRTKEYLERQRIARQIAEDRAKHRAAVEDKRQTETQQQDKEIRFLLTELQIDKSTVLTEAEINMVTENYLGQEISLDDIYKIVNAINAIYNEKGYITCRAYLPPQIIKKGVVHIALIEGRTGNVFLEGNKSTQTSYITDRIDLPENNIANIHDLNDNLLHFNGTNDVQLRIAMQAGSEPGTTDYIISAFEPQRTMFSVYADNSGNKDSGEWREGLFYTNRSLTGSRDALTLNGMRSDGTKSFSSSYSVPVGRSGNKLGFNYSANSVHMTDGELEDMDVRGHSTAYGVSFTQPLRVDEKMRTEAMLEYGRQNSQTDFLGIHWVDDTINAYTASLAMTNYSDTSVVYSRHAYRFGNWDNIDAVSKNFGKYFFNSFFQKAYAHGQMLSGRLDFQFSSTNYLPSAEQFYIGGVYSVRGYEESKLGGDSGYSASLEYAVPMDDDKKVTAFTFFDYGSVHGDNAFEEMKIA